MRQRRLARKLTENQKKAAKSDLTASPLRPMMEWTDRHCRFFHRLLTRRALLYTEMLTTGAVLHGDRARLLRFDPAEHPVALQLGGSEPRALAAAAASPPIAVSTRSTSMSAARRTGCSRAASAPA